MMNDSEIEWINVRQASEESHLSPATLLALHRDGRINSIKPSRQQRLYDRASVQAEFARRAGLPPANPDQGPDVQRADGRTELQKVRAELASLRASIASQVDGIVARHRALLATDMTAIRERLDRLEDAKAKTGWRVLASWAKRARLFLLRLA